jgi:hypothetical protein
VQVQRELRAAQGARQVAARQKREEHPFPRTAARFVQWLTASQASGDVPHRYGSTGPDGGCKLP